MLAEIVKLPEGARATATTVGIQIFGLTTCEIIFIFLLVWQGFHGFVSTAAVSRDGNAWFRFILLNPLCPTIPQLSYFILMRRKKSGHLKTTNHAAYSSFWSIIQQILKTKKYLLYFLQVQQLNQLKYNCLSFKLQILFIQHIYTSSRICVDAIYFHNVKKYTLVYNKHTI